MGVEDFIMTLDSDPEDAPPPPKAGKSKAADAEDAVLNPEFSFDLAGDVFEEALGQEELNGVALNGKPTPVSVDDIIARRKLTSTSRKRKRLAIGEDETSASENEGSGASSSGSDEDEEDLNEAPEGEDSEEEADPLATSGEDDSDVDEEPLNDDEAEATEGDESSSDESEPETQAQKDRKAAFFDSASSATETPSSFVSMNLSRPILKALTSLGFHTPTPIQSATIPVALLGKDVVGNAVTGSGKTAAFIIPMLERLLYREKGKKAAATRCLVLVPTRELGVQCFEVGKKLAAHTDVQFCLTVGGLSVKAQEAALRTRPDVVIATPGRLIDHIRNSPAFTLDALDILVLDEADRMLADGFAEELNEIIKSCPTGRQTMLFSATMTDSVDELVRMSLSKPVRLFVDPKRSTARGLVQEFVRVRAGKEAERSAMLVALCKRSFKSGVIVFFRSKKLAHQLRIVFGLLNMKCDELHGDLTQEQRLRALQAFRDGQVDYLMATDLASRGLDIKGVETVVNYDMPAQLAQYLHRVGRTARAGKKGRSVTLVGEGDRKLLKAVIKHSSDQDNIRHRLVPADIMASWAKEVESLKHEVIEIMQEEKEEKQLRQAERDVKKGENMIEHEKEIFSRPARTWFQSAKDKAKAEAVSKDQYEAKPTSKARLDKTKATADEKKPKRDKFSGLTRRAKRRKLAAEEDEERGDIGAISASVRAAKKTQRPVKIGEAQPKRQQAKKVAKRKKAAGRVTGASFERDLGQKGAREGVRARKGDVIAGIGKKKTGKVAERSKGAKKR